jgi:hypothetical protein
MLLFAAMAANASAAQAATHDVERNFTLVKLYKMNGSAIKVASECWFQLTKLHFFF